MPTMTRPKTSGVDVAPLPAATTSPAPALSTPAPTDAIPTVPEWEYRMLLFMFFCILVMWGMIVLELFGTSFWLVFDIPH